MRTLISTRIPARIRWAVLGAALLGSLLAASWVDRDASSAESAAAAAVVAPAMVRGQPAAVAGTTGSARATPASTPDSGAGAAARAPATLARTLVGLEQRRMSARAAGDAFAPAAWSAQAQTASEAGTQAGRERAAAAAPAPPMAPPLPFTFFGRLHEGDRQQVFLTHGSRTLIVAAGETIDNQYRVERIAADAVHFTYLPLGQTQVLALPGTQQ